MQAQRTCPRPGAIVPLIAVLMIGLLACVALAIDLGLVMLARNQCQAAADIAALAGTRQLNGLANDNNNYDAATPAARTAATSNKVLEQPITADNVTAEVGWYTYNSTTQRFEPQFEGNKPAGENWSAVRVTVNATRPTYFARVLGMNSFTATATATAVHRPRDVAIVLDFSGSMRFNSLSAYPYTGDKLGSLNPDPKIPRFGPWSTMASVMQRTTAYIDSNGQVFAPCNLTVETSNGPAIINDFLMRDASGALVPAFVRSLSSYDPLVWAVPAPADWDLQADTTFPYVGDRWPLKNRGSTGTNYAATIQEYLTGSNTTQSNTHAKSTVTGPGGGRFDPVTYTNPQTNEGYGPNFKGYSMGPGWYGKTFYIWPPDPRWHPTNPALQLDWRKKFFFDQGTTTPLGGTSGDTRVDNSRLWDSSGYWRQANSSSYSVNYTAIIQWIKSGPQVFPPNLRAGRLVYYTAIPDSIPATGGTADQRFWRGYIDYVIGTGSASTQRGSLYGRHSTGWGTVRITAKSSVRGPDNLAGTSDDPYMHYNDNPIPPRLHFWFGPLTLLDFISRYTNNWLPGTSHESQCWQLKAGVQSALNDIEKNHPNDWVSLIYFSHLSTYSTARVSLGRDYPRMKNALFFPFSLLNNLSDTNAEIRPYQNNDSLTWDSPGNVPVGNGGTSPEMGFKIAYNQFSSRPGYSGRRGAAKVVIFETDGVPNHTAAGSFNYSGPYNSYYNVTGSTTSYSNNDPTVVNAALDVIQTICNLDTHATRPGYSTAKMPARVHAIGFGDLFQYDSQSRDDGLSFLLEVQKRGNTSPASATSIESYKIITGDYNTRVDNLRQALERIMQSGIQVSLIR